MLEPDLVRGIVSSMQRVSSLPVTVKCRIGVDDQDSYDELKRFIGAVSEGGARKFVIHARKCILKGLSPKQNRDVPPLRYELVHALVRDFPDLTFVLNGGVLSLDEAAAQMTGAHPVSGVMIGRAVFNNPLMLACADSTFYGTSDVCHSRRRVVEGYMDYCDWAQSDEGPLRVVAGKRQQATSALLLKPVHNLMVGLANNSRYKVALNDEYVARVRAGEPNPPPRDIVRPPSPFLSLLRHNKLLVADRGGYALH